MKTLYFNCSAGISGDMIAGALLDLSGDREALVADLELLKLPGYTLDIQDAEKLGVKAVKFDVLTEDEATHRYLDDILKIIGESGLSDAVKALAMDIFITLGRAEAKAHEVPISRVHFHEVGAIDSIVDVVAAAILIDALKPEQILCSAVSVGKGTVKYSHGETELPVPAVREILGEVSLTVLDINSELTTPTGAAIIRTIADRFVTLDISADWSCGRGAGTKDLTIANVLEIYQGDMDKVSSDLLMLETNIDDMNPELYDAVIDKLLDAGALDVFVTPCRMKKNRPGVLLQVLCTKQTKDELTRQLFEETTTLGIRTHSIDRQELGRKFIEVQTPYGIVHVKVGELDGEIINASPEYEDCKKIALEKNIPVRRVYNVALLEAHRQLL